MKSLLPTLTIAALFASFSVTQAADWPQWRGPSQDGISQETAWQVEWPDDDPPIVWNANVGTGFASVSVANGLLFTTGHANGQDTIWCLNATTGETVWKHSFAEPLLDKYYEGGPSATPTVHNDVVYSISKSGLVFCLDRDNGTVVWQVDAAQLTGSPMPTWGFGGSPVVYGDFLLLNMGGSGVALDKNTGALKWKSEAEEAGYTTPYIMDREDGVYAIFSSGRDFTGREVSSGEEVARWAWKTRYGVNAADPVVDGDRVFISSGYRKGATVVDISSGEPVEVWKNKEMETQMNPCILINGFLYGCSGDQGDRSTTLKCISMDTGETRWTFPGIGPGSLTAAKGNLIVLTARGELMFAPISPNEFEPVFQMQVLGGKCWTVPVLANGRIYCRNSDGDLVCVDVRGS